MPDAAVFEKLGLFYLGRRHGSSDEDLVLYDARDLTTHAVIIGMTGSGKTGLGVTLLEEAAIDGIPAIVVDPKGDLASLALTFPSLRGEDFLPWVDADEARRRSLTVEALADAEAARVREGLGRWGEDGGRVARLRDAAEVVVYTPGGSAGRPLSLLRSLSAPSPAVLGDPESLRDRVSATASALLGLVDVQSEPTQGREHILLSLILDGAWRARRDVALGDLVQALQSPPVQRVGVIDLESFFSARDRFGLAMRFNNLLASPSAAAWLEGEPLDVASLLRSPSGKPRLSVLHLAHLGDAERSAFLTVLLAEVSSWMRAQPGTTSLRALLYLDEVAGLLPPVANPPTKAPLLRLLKQARAFGLGVVLATQNPVDVDYKALSNAGTWFLGRLQTARDVERVAAGLAGAAEASGRALDRGALERQLSSLQHRVFLMHDVHLDEDCLLETRQTLCYLRGPLAREELRRLGGATVTGAAATPSPSTMPASQPAFTVAGQSSENPWAQVMGSAALPAPAAPEGPAMSPLRQVLPADVPSLFLPPSNPFAVAYEPRVLGLARVSFVDGKLGLDETRTVALLATVSDGLIALDWSHAERLDLDVDAVSALPREPLAGASFLPVPSVAAQGKSYAAWTRDLATHLAATETVTLLRSGKERSRPGETERDFRARLSDGGREQRDARADQLRQKLAPRLRTLDERIRRARQAVQREAEQASNAKLSTAMSIGSTLLGSFLGKKVISQRTIGGVASSVRGVGRSLKEGHDVERANETVAALEAQREALAAELESEIAALDAGAPAAHELAVEAVVVHAKKTAVKPVLVALAWRPR